MTGPHILGALIIIIVIAAFVAYCNSYEPEEAEVVVFPPRPTPAPVVRVSKARPVSKKKRA